MLTGAGVLAAYDIRSLEPSSLGGLLQSSNYIAGISGGAWLVMSNLAHNFKPIIVSTLGKNSMWDLTDSLLEGVPNFNLSIMETEKDGEPSDPVSLSPNIEIPPQMLVAPSVHNTPNLKDQNFFQSLFNKFKIIPVNASPLQSEAPPPTASSNSLLEIMLKPIFSSYKKNTATEIEQPKNSFTSLKKIISFYKDIHLEVRSKKASGFPISLTDYWGRALARRIFPRAIRSPGVTLTSATRMSTFRDYEQPFPIISAIETVPETQTQQQNSATSHTFEINPFEFGSWDSFLNSFVDIKYLGTKLRNGIAVDNKCVSGFDNLGFLTGTSSSLFNYAFVYLYENFKHPNSPTVSALQNILKTFGLRPNSKSWKDPQQHPDYALISPNPFLEKVVKGTRDISKRDHIFLTDGGGDGQNIPFHPFIQYSRNIDVIFAFDMSGDLQNYPNGTCLIRSSQRYHSNRLDTPIFEVTPKVISIINRRGRMVKSAFPKVPDCEEFMKLKYNEKPVFFGCDLDKDYPDRFPLQIPAMDAMGRRKDYLPPLIVYTANTNHSFQSNTSTFKLSYTNDEVLGMIGNGYNLATYLNATIEQDYSMCISCAILKRKFDREMMKSYLNFTIPIACSECYDKYCYTKA